MALKATVFKVNLQIADMDRNYYQDHQLTLAQHPSETDGRMMVRLLAFIVNASETLSFSKGLCVDDEPELWDKTLSGEIDLWVEFGQADEKWLRKASGRAKVVQLFTYGGRSVPIWWKQNQQALERYQNLTVWNIAEESVTAMEAFVGRNMALQVSISEGQIWLSDNDTSVLIEPEILKDIA
ncbi:YaeQ family protein [Shewanella sp. SP2S2-4]|uniref:YaeQ family protein n=1 Tax=Shewanella vaxholmensis TaxID=3063535 RepID=A0ABU9UY42_9GAMM|nr:MULTISPECIES: YaeQ family protein [unclassified Shewanella]MDT3274923.1 YaeQ family protein [Shewanella sp. SP2S2-4]MDT3309538.1 YaeQ family protein [Shewanella sp. SP1S1-4]MDT3336639.1 YaeQ family protein [Shewanella sp. SP1S1-7]